MTAWKDAAALVTPFALLIAMIALLLRRKRRKNQAVPAPAKQTSPRLPVFELDYISGDFVERKGGHDEYIRPRVDGFRKTA